MSSKGSEGPNTSAASVWAVPTRTLSDYSGVWGVATRALTDKTNFLLASQASPFTDYTTARAAYLDYLNSDAKYLVSVALGTPTAGSIGKLVQDIYSFLLAYLDQAVKTTSSPTFPGLTIGSLSGLLRVLSGVVSVIPYSYGQKLIVGNYYRSIIMVGAFAQTGAPAINSLQVVLYPITQKATYDRIAIRVSGITGSGNKVRLGLYKDNGSGYPSSLVFDAGEVAVSGAGMSTIIINIQLDVDNYWIGFIMNTANISVYYSNTGLSVGDLLGVNDFTTSPIMQLYVSQAYGAFPATFPAGASATGNMVAIGLRLASIP